MPHRPIQVWGDNRICVALSEDARSHGSSAHFARRISFAQDVSKEGPDRIFRSEHLTTDNNPVDFLGKLVNAGKHRSSSTYLMNLSMEVEPTEEDKHYRECSACNGSAATE